MADTPMPNVPNDTPRTNALAIDARGWTGFIEMREFARELERENASLRTALQSAREEAERLRVRREVYRLAILNGLRYESRLPAHCVATMKAALIEPDIERAALARKGE